MADKKISDLTATTSVASGDLFEMENAGGNSRKITGTNLAAGLAALSSPLTKPTVAGFTITLNSASGTDGTSSLYLTGTAAANTLRGLLKSLPGGDFSVTIKLDVAPFAYYNAGGIIFRDTGGKYVVLTLGLTNNTIEKWVVAFDQWSSSTAFNANAGTFSSTGGLLQPAPGVGWLKVAFTSSTSAVTGYYSPTGENWLSMGSSTYLSSADAFGIVAAHNNASQPPRVWFEHFATA